MKKSKSDAIGSLDLLLDTHILVWIATLDPRMSKAAEQAIIRVENGCWVSSVTAWEFVDLNRRGRFGADLDLRGILDMLDARVLGFPAEAWLIAPALPLLHQDPVDRMLIAHAIHADLTLVTADATMRDYPVKSLW